jgi:hypothetical protein
MEWRRVTLRTLFTVVCGPSPCHAVAPYDVVEVGETELGRIPRSMNGGGPARQEPALLDQPTRDHARSGRSEGSLLR